LNGQDIEVCYVRTDLTEKHSDVNAREGDFTSGGHRLTAVKRGSCDLVVVEQKLYSRMPVGDQPISRRRPGPQWWLSRHHRYLQSAFFLVEQRLEDARAATEATKYGAFTQTGAGSEAIHSDPCGAHFDH
jgi:hypothetical protein